MKRWERGLRAFDLARVVPRAALVFYGWQMMRVQEWFMGLADPSASQAAFTATVWGVAPLLLNFYMAAGVDWKPTPPKDEAK